VAKKIVVFADGTGNAFTLQESNVWRLYQALDKSRPDQIARYIKGVGTSGFRPFALVDGATGIGVPSNVRELYRFLCWNWQVGDEIYMFGFSRGAFTIRTLIGLIDKEGLVPTRIGSEPVSHAEMQYYARAAWRSYRAKTVPRRKSLPTIWIARAIRDICLAVCNFILRRRSYKKLQKEIESQKRIDVRVKFAGLFDTVEAYGVPIEELRGAIDWAIWPISFRNQILSELVDCARHALSLDDERTTFRPLRFDMTAETTKRIKELWFAGVHSDVGGGYPDSALAYVPLVWIAEEAMTPTDKSGLSTSTGLRYCSGALDGFRSQASPFGPLHDSRKGLAVLYRYDPRNIAEDKPSGGPPVIHHSVAEKMAFGSENYVPITLPSTAFVLMPDGSKHKIEGFSDTPAAKSFAATSDKKGREINLAVDAVGHLSAPDKDLVSLTRDTIWWRRVTYFALLFSVITAVSLPVTARWIANTFHAVAGALAALVGLGTYWSSFWANLANADSGIRTNLHSISRTVGGFLPGYTKYWIDVVVSFPLASGSVILIVLLLYQRNAILRDLIADRARQAWFFATRDTLSETKKHDAADASKPGLLMTFARFMRKSKVVNWTQYLISDFVLPAIGLVVIFGVAAVTVSRTTVSYRAGQGVFCQPTIGKPLVPSLEGVPIIAGDKFQISKFCWASGISLEKGRHYTIWIEMVEPFLDQTIMTDIAGFRDLSLRHLLALSVRRWWSADWFQPIARIGAAGDEEWPLQSIDGAEALNVGVGADGNPVPIRFYDAPEYASRLKELQDGEPKSDPSRLSGCQKIPDSELATAQSIRRKQQNLRTTYVSQFTAPDNGELFLYVNDAIAAVPFVPTIECFYVNNSGTAKVTIERSPVPMPTNARALN
jgi:uncharacterized protein (DUF2235 family)